MNIREPLTQAELSRLLQGIDRARVALLGDLCLDLYWTADMRLSELSRETPNYPLPVVEERFSPGGAGNVAANLAALKPAKLTVLGVIGNDWRGGLLAQALEQSGVDASRLIRQDGFVTNTYVKPLRRGISDVVYESPRIDFENRGEIPEELEKKLLRALEETADDFDVLCVSDQMKRGIITPRVREAICRLGKRVVVDSRDRIALYHGVTVKPNEVEASRAFGCGTDPEALAEALPRIEEQNGAPMIVTLGDKGCLTCENGNVTLCPALRVPPPIDIVGAGDTFLSAVGCALASGASLADAAALANLASAVTIRKIGVTGTASREEIQSV